MANVELPQRIIEKISFQSKSECWEWNGYVRPDGYGETRWKKNSKWGHELVHRLTYQAYVGPIPFELQIDHICKNTRCCNPNHLQAVTAKQNCATRNDRSDWTHCSHGHEFTPENTMKRGSYRQCRTCHNEANRRNRPPKTERGLTKRALVEGAYNS